MKIALYVIAGLFGAFLLFGFVVGSSPEAKERQREQDSIATCWESHERKSLAPPEKRFIASTCEMMEANFAKKHNRRP